MSYNCLDFNSFIHISMLISCSPSGWMASVFWKPWFQLWLPFPTRYLHLSSDVASIVLSKCLVGALVQYLWCLSSSTMKPPNWSLSCQSLPNLSIIYVAIYVIFIKHIWSCLSPSQSQNVNWILKLILYVMVQKLILPTSPALTLLLHTLCFSSNTFVIPWACPALSCLHSFACAIFILNSVVPCEINSSTFKGHVKHDVFRWSVWIPSRWIIVFTLLWVYFLMLLPYLPHHTLTCLSSALADL